MNIFSKTLFCALALLTVTGTSLFSQVLDKATFEGQVTFPDGKPQAYTLAITYKASAAEPDGPRGVAKIALTIAGKEVSFPAASYADIKDAHRCTPLVIYGLNLDEVMFEIEAGDGEDSNTVMFIASQNRLLSREVHSPHSEKPDVTKYSKGK